MSSDTLLKAGLTIGTLFVADKYLVAQGTMFILKSVAISASESISLVSAFEFLRRVFAGDNVAEREENAGAFVGTLIIAAIPLTPGNRYRWLDNLNTPESWRLARAARAGGETAKRTTRAAVSEANAELVTHADRASDKVMGQVLRKYFPELNHVSEEETATHALIGSGKRITLRDPIDGTNVAAVAEPHWGVSACIIDEAGKVVSSAIFYPAYGKGGTMVTSDLGRGTFINGRRFVISVNPVAKNANLQAIPVSPKMSALDFEFAKSFVRLLKEKGVLGTDYAKASAVGNVFSVLKGNIRVYINLGAGKVWDVAPLELVVNEAKGVAVTPGGQPIVWNTLKTPILFSPSTKTAQPYIDAYNELKAFSRSRSEV